MKPENLNKGDLYQNQTFKWLRPILSYVLPEYLKKYMKLSDYNIKVLGYFRGDFLYEDATLDDSKDLMFVVFDVNGKIVGKKYKSTKIGKEHFYEFLEQVRKSKYGYCDYPCKFENRDIHIVVFKLNGWDQSFINFDNGKYSKIFTKTEFSKLTFTNKQEIHWIINKKEEAKKLFKKKLEERFGTKVLPDTTEYEIKPLTKEEWLNEK